MVALELFENFVVEGRACISCITVNLKCMQSTAESQPGLGWKGP